MPLLSGALGFDTRSVILAAGLMFLWALLLGVLKYRQILASPDGAAHPYTDIAHRAALLYSFALMLIAVFVQLSAWAMAVDLAAASALALFFVISVYSYMHHGLRQDTDNQLKEPSAQIRAFMAVLIVAEIGGFVILLAGFIASFWIPQTFLLFGESVYGG
jgi:uncharacterized membrane protein